MEVVIINGYECQLEKELDAINIYISCNGFYGFITNKEGFVLAEIEAYCVQNVAFIEIK